MKLKLFSFIYLLFIQLRIKKLKVEKDDLLVFKISSLKNHDQIALLVEQIVKKYKCKVMILDKDKNISLYKYEETKFILDEIDKKFKKE